MIITVNRNEWAFSSKIFLEEQAASKKKADAERRNREKQKKLE